MANILSLAVSSPGLAEIYMDYLKDCQSKGARLRKRAQWAVEVPLE
jgi:hypothetical protein